jgi:hypothetical protein
MPRKTEGTETGAEQFRFPAGLVLKPAVSAEDLKADTEHHPEGAEEFVTLLRTLRKEGSRPLAF